MPTTFDPRPDALRIRRRQATIKDVPEKHRAVVAKTLAHGPTLSRYAREQATPASRRFIQTHIRAVRYL